MKRTIKKWTIRIASTALLLFGILIGIAFNPSLLYANKTEVESFIIYHNEDLSPEIEKRLMNARKLLKDSELYNPEVELKICLNDNALYPKLIDKLAGPTFGRGFYDIIVMQGSANHEANTVELNGYKWDLEQLIAHEAIHCYQFDKLGFWKSGPLNNYPHWKWEGYPEYVSRQNDDQTDLRHNIDRLLKYNEESPGNWDISFSDGTIAPISYYKDWLLVQYCLDVQELSYEELLQDSRARADVEKEMWSWYNGE